MQAIIKIRTFWFHLENLSETDTSPRTLLRSFFVIFGIFLAIILGLPVFKFGENIFKFNHNASDLMYPIYLVAIYVTHFSGDKCEFNAEY